MVVTVNFEDLDGLVGGAGLGGVSGSRVDGWGSWLEDVQQDVFRNSPERSHAR